MPIAISCDCGKDFNVKNELAGKKIKCPGCQSVLKVPGGSLAEAVGEKPQTTGKRNAADDEDNYDDEAGRQEGKKKKKKKSKKGVNPLLFVGLGCGALALVLLCAGGGVLAYFLLSSPSPERAIVGRWTIDIDATKKLYPENDPKMKIEVKNDKETTLEFKSDGTIVDSKNTSGVAKWKVRNVKGDKATLEITETRGSNTTTIEMDFVVKGRNQLHLGAEKGFGPLDKGFILKRL